MPSAVAFGCVSWLLMESKPWAAAGVLLCFSGLLRASEMLTLLWTNLVRVPHGFVVVLGLTKRGQEQSVLLCDPSVVAWLDSYAKRFRVSSGRAWCPSRTPRSSDY